MTEQTPRNFSIAQWSFIQKVRDKIKADAKAFFAENNWRSIVPNAGRYDSALLNKGSKRTSNVESFYVKSIACWVPHLLIDGHTPKCPHCKTSRYVTVAQARWINKPKILYGIARHQYLDTLLYPCKGCARRFSGYHPVSMQLDAGVYYGYFNFYLGPTYAVDEELYRLVTLACATQATTAIARTLKHLCYNAYYADHQLYLSAVGVEKIKAPKKKSLFKVTAFLEEEKDPEARRLRKKKHECGQNVRYARMSLQAAMTKAQADIKFRAMLDSKSNHNVHGDNRLIQGLGPTKLHKLIASQIYSCFELLKADPLEYSIQIRHLLPRWAAMVKKHYDILENLVKECKQSLQSRLDDLKDAEAAYDNYKKSEQGNDREPQEPVMLDGESNSMSWKPPMFSKFSDKSGYGGRLVSKHVIDGIVTSMFNQRKSFIEAKMSGLNARMLKIDYNYKLAKKIRVWTKQGQSFCPYKCIITVQNEDCQTVFWKALKHSESFTEIKPDLQRLKQRLDRNLLAKRQAEVARCREEAAKNGVEFNVPDPVVEDAVMVIYVDNCCNVHRVLKSIFPSAIILLDIFHWLRRWNDALHDPKSLHAGVVRAMICSAVFTIDPQEYSNAKERVCAKLLKRNIHRVPTVKEIRNEARTTIPNPGLLRQNVEGVYFYFTTKDLQTAANLALRQEGDTSPAPKQFFKHPSAIRDIVQQQFRHIDRGCLSDPPTTVVRIHRQNPVTGAVFVARGTNTNERDNLDLSLLLSATHVGIARGDRIMWTFFDERNNRKGVIRLGEEDIGTNHTETLLSLNSFAKTIGVSDEDLPYKSLSAPSVDPTKTEFMGFQYGMSNAIDNVCNPTQPNQRMYDDNIVDDDEHEELEPQESVVDQSLMEGDSDDIDVEVIVDPGQFPLPTAEDEADAQGVIDLVEREAAVIDADMANREYIQAELTKLMPDIGKETTLQTFKRLTNDAAWFPFRLPTSTTPETEIDKEEALVFEQLLNDGQYQRHAKQGTKTFKRFEAAWNNEVANRFRRWSEGDFNVIQIRLKTVSLLQQYYDQWDEYQQLQASAPRENDTERQTLQRVFRETRLQLLPTEHPHQAERTAYVPLCNGAVYPFGVPQVLNANILVNAVARSNHTATTNATPFLMTLPNLPLERAAAARPKAFRSRKYCTTCGWRRTEHRPSEGKAGKSCKRSYCGKCYQLKQHHDDVTAFGPKCPYPTNRYCIQVTEDWYCK
jgi:hypothetical protein